MQQPILYDFKLQLSDSADNLAAVELVYKQLCNAFVHELLYAFFQLL